ncbi:S1/P1 nuclease [Legionella hackeliae]|uniref:Predicted nucleoside-diphosphate sugar epimerase n=1 Tax=Legionella hackeliae TaxID=449 RepID=A0A0A8UU93_LEGHA|nr:S1/P1 nuclease [Legionella hackeliae]KTD13908.1 3'-nucleotidase/nuclease [Legionella hackeliae]CEK10612.1 Predicted nucleoside-diphosphate sugar epimerase [Legionella hackeliae]STX47354.1 3'-nucleotidase/nuclease [Legionella hackeliae]
MMKRAFLAVVLGLSLIGNSYSWNSLGHRLVAQIAYHHLNPHTRQILNQYNHALDKAYRPQSLVNSAVWLDSLRYQNELWLGPKHYIDIPFSFDGTELIEPDHINAVTAINSAKRLMQNSAINDFEKGFTLRILLHVVGDIHQPLHAANQFSAKHPKGDLGGNLFPLKNNSVATNLHAYWDKGGGWLNTRKHYSAAQLSKKARIIEKHWPCRLREMNLDPQVWAQESHELAVQKAYQIQYGQQPTKLYQQLVKAAAEQRIAIAGCRLAALLNQIAHW